MVKRTRFPTQAKPHTPIPVKTYTPTEWLYGYLKAGPKPARLLLQRAKAEGYSTTLLFRLKKELGVRAYQDKDGQWIWRWAQSTKFPIRKLTPKPVEDDLMLLIRATRDCLVPFMDEVPAGVSYEEVRRHAIRIDMVAVGTKVELAHVVRRWREKREKV